MKQNSICIALLLFLFGTQHVMAQKLTTKADSLAYAVGMEYAKQMKAAGFKNVDLKIFNQAFQDIQAKQETKLDDATATMIYQMEVRKLDEEKKTMNQANGIAFLKEMKSKPGVKALDKGILYEVLKPGDQGAKPAPDADVTIHYEGKLIDGSVFDSSFKRGKPNTFNLKRLIKGWQIALPEMTKGSKWRIYIPHEQAYGARGAGGMILPYSALVFDIELFDFNKVAN